MGHPVPKVALVFMFLFPGAVFFLFRSMGFLDNSDEYYPLIVNMVIAALPFAFLFLFSRQKMRTDSLEKFKNGLYRALFAVLTVVLSSWGVLLGSKLFVTGFPFGLALIVLISPVVSIFAMNVAYSRSFHRDITTSS